MHIRVSQLLVGGVFLLVSCGQAPIVGKSSGEAGPKPGATTAIAWPSELRVLGDGFPKPGDPCRRLGESALTINYLDDSAQLVGCPGEASAAASMAIVNGLGGRVVGAADGVTFISIPQGDANVGMEANAPAGSGAAPQPDPPTNGE